ncbi:unnamed protein product [Allacma fusca]|uniref:C2H2-type domain-containing protein n=1 Tax=Allacma fusca TaxID=39272 RepID=A0A8J2KSC3_9HEXA|nr:unnamed protein product [Allacma fusca]
MSSRNKPQCVICCSETSALKSKDSVVAEILLEIFQNFAKYMNWKIGSNGFDFNHEPFPFCQPCKVVLVELSNLSQDVEKILGRIKTITTQAAGRIVLSNLKNRELNDDDDNLEQNTTSPGKIDEFAHARKLDYFRKQTIEEYSPNIKLQTDLKMQKRKRKNKFNDERFELKFPRIGLMSIDSIKGFKLESSPADKATSDTVSPNSKRGSEESRETICNYGVQEFNNSSNNLEQVSKKDKERFQCSDCITRFSNKQSWELHTTLTCGKYNTKDTFKTIGHGAYSFDGLPFSKTSGGKYSCGTCSSSFTTIQYMKFHVRKVHSGTVYPTNDSRDNEERSTDTKSLLKEVNHTAQPNIPAVNLIRRRTNGKVLNKQKLQEDVLKLYANMMLRMKI